MKLRLSLLLAVSALSASCATPSDETVLAMQGVNTPYLSRLLPNGTDNPTAMYTQAFEGWRFMENRDGSCALQLSRVSAMVEINTPSGPVQRPTTKVLTIKVDCEALTQGDLPALPGGVPKPALNNKMI